MKKLLLVSIAFAGLFVYPLSNVNAQGVGINPSGNPPNSSSGLDVDFTNKGLLVPRINLSSTTDVSTIPSPATYLIVYNTNPSTTNGNGVGLYYYDGSKWVYMVASTNGPGTSGQVLTSGGAGVPASWATSVTGWSLNGNSGISGTNFIGTTDNNGLRLKVNNQPSGFIDNSVNAQTSFGYQAGLNNAGANNSFFGFGSGKANTTATANTAIGFSSLFSNTSGSYNTAAGYQSLYNDNGGNNNTAYGVSSLYSNATGSINTAVGVSALYGNTAGGENVAVGASSMANNNKGSWNTACGNGALWGNTTAGNNTALGYQALFTQSYDNGGTSWNTVNTAIGYYALHNNQPTSTSNGQLNTAVGANALGTNTTGYYNTANGNNALNSNTTGYTNTAIGVSALYSNTTGFQNASIGYNSLAFNSTGVDNVAIGHWAGYGASSVNFNQCTFIGSTSFPTQARSNVTMLGYGIANAQCTGDNQVLLGNTAISQIRAQVTGITGYSDGRFKINIKNNVSGLDFILKLKPVTYQVKPRELYKIWGTPDSLVTKMDFSETEKEIRIGFIAQDVERAAKESGFNFPGIDVPRNDQEVYTLRYVDFIMPIVKAMQEQQKIIEGQEKTLNELKAENNSLKTDVDAIRHHLEIESEKLKKLNSSKYNH